MNKNESKLISMRYFNATVQSGIQYTTHSEWNTVSHEREY